VPWSCIVRIGIGVVGVVAVAVAVAVVLALVPLAVLVLLTDVRLDVLDGGGVGGVSLGILNGSFLIFRRCTWNGLL